MTTLDAGNGQSVSDRWQVPPGELLLALDRQCLVVDRDPDVFPFDVR
jgi:hypothetical protein